MAWRETRGAHHHFVYFLVCITVGVGALVAVQSFSDSLARTVARSAKSLLGADVEIRSTHPLSTESAAIVGGLGREGSALTSVREMAAMAQAGHASRSLLVELKAVEGGYPFYGRLVTDPDRPLASLLGHGQALVHPSFLTRLGLAVGDRIRIGDLDLVISGVIREEPDRSLGVFSLGPRVLIAEDLDHGIGQIRQPGPLSHADQVAPRKRPTRSVMRWPCSFRTARCASSPLTSAAGVPPVLDAAHDGLAMTGLVALIVGGSVSRSACAPS
jgi:putative ABC transport system permease protein